MRALKPETWPRPAGYAHGMEVPAGGRLVFLAGQVGNDAEKRFPGTLAGQFEQALANLLAVLAEAGGGPADICRITGFCTDKPAYEGERKAIGEAWRRQMGRHYPAMSMIFVSALTYDAARIELEATAVVAGPPTAA